MCICVCVLAIVSFTVSVCGNWEILHNGCFNLVDKDGNVLYWLAEDPLADRGQRDHGLVQLVFDREVTYVGNGSLRIHVPFGAEKHFPRWKQRLDNVEDVLTISISAKAKTKDIVDGSGAYINFEYFDAEGTRIGFKNGKPFITGTTDDWVTLAVDDALPSGVHSVYINLLLNGYGTAWFDDVKILQVF